MKVTISNGLERVVLTSHPFNLSKKVDLSGLAADITTINTNRDGSDYLKSLFQNRDVDFEGYIRTYGMEKATIQNHRNTLYRLWNPKNKITVEFEDENDYYMIEGYPTSFPVFQTGFANDNNTFLRFLLQMTCTDPFIYRNKKTVVFADITPTFSFPLEFTDVSFGEKSNSLIETIVNDGVMDCPIEVTMISTGTVVNPYLLNVYTGKQIKFNTTLSAGETLYVNTGRKKQVLKMTSSETEIFYSSLDLDSYFLQLEVGDNVLKYDSDEGTEYLRVEVAYRERLGGI